MDSIRPTCLNKVNEGQKLISALYEISKDDFTVSDDTILDKLFVHIENSADVKDFLWPMLPEFVDWLKKVFDKWNENTLFYGVKIFVVRFVGFMGSSSIGFNFMKEKDVLSYITKLATSSDIQDDSCLMVPLINIFEKFLKHKDGLDWVIETRIWKHVITVLSEDQSIYIRRAGVKFVSLLLSTTSNHECKVSREILLAVCEPLIQNHVITIDNCCCGNHHHLQNESDCISAKQVLYPIGNISISSQTATAAQSLCDILEDLSSVNACVPSKLKLVFRSVGDIDSSVLVADILNKNLSPQNHQTFSLLLFMMGVCNVQRDSRLDPLSTCSMKFKRNHFFWVIKSMISQGHFNTVINFCVTSLSLHTRLQQRSKCLGLHCYFEDIVVLCLKSFLDVRCFYLNRQFMEETPEDDFSISLIIRKYLFSKITEMLIETVQSREMILHYVKLGVFGITRSLSYIKDHRNIGQIFSTVLSTLDTMVRVLNNGQQVLNSVILQLLNLASKLIESHQIPYCKIFDDNNISLYMVIVKILGQDDCDVRVTITALQITIQVLQYHTIADLIGKVQNIQDFDPGTQRYGLSELISKLKSTSWEVRDTVLEVFQTVLEPGDLIPWIYLEPFESDLLTKILDIAVSDENAYVRASALNFFSKAVRCKIFDDIISSSLLLDLGLKKMLEDDMPVTRRAACDLVNALYIVYVLNESREATRIYEAMFKTTMKDLDWEVKRAALVFWRCTIDKHLMEEIIPLNSSFLQLSRNRNAKDEATSRIMNVLNKLSEIGCLKAIWLGMIDECDLKVSQEASYILDHLENLDKQYNFVETILNDGEHLNQDAVDGPCHQLKPKEFFFLLRTQDWRNKLDSRRDWIENSCDDLPYLLDHILNTENKMNDCDHNAVDCY